MVDTIMDESSELVSMLNNVTCTCVDDEVQIWLNVLDIHINKCEAWMVSYIFE